jgi:hypothetical protein
VTLNGYATEKKRHKAHAADSSGPLPHRGIHAVIVCGGKGARDAVVMWLLGRDYAGEHSPSRFRIALRGVLFSSVISWSLMSEVGPLPAWLVLGLKVWM